MFRKLLPPILLLFLFGSIDFWGYERALFELLSRFMAWASEQPAWIVVIISAIENAIFINVYTPGSLILLATMASASGDPLRIVIVYLSISIGTAIGHTFNFVLGSAISREEASGKQPSKFATFASFVHPHISAINSFRLGVIGIPYSTFLYLAVPSIALWNAFWTILVLTLWAEAEGILNLKFLGYAYLIFWMLFVLVSHSRGRLEKLI